MDAPFTIIDVFTRKATSGDPKGVLDALADSALIIIDGKRYTPAGFATAFAANNKHWSFDMLEVLCSDEVSTQAVFEVALLRAENGTYKQEARYHATMTWSGMNEKELQIIHIMASRA